MSTAGKTTKIIVCVLIITGLSGCWNSRELNKLGIVMGVGIDRDVSSETVKITAQVVKAGAMTSGGKGGGNGEKGYINFEDYGNTVFAAVRDITNQCSRKLYFPHNRVIILGRDVAEEGVTKYLDFFLRDPETRLNVYVLVARDSARDLFYTDPELEKIPAYAISHLVDGEAVATSQSMAVMLKEFKDRLMSKTSAAFAPIVEVYEENDKKTARINGTAVFKGDKLVGELDKTEGRGLLWTLGEVKSGIIETRSSQGNAVAMETVRSNGGFSVKLDNGKPVFTITVKEEGNVGEQAGPENLSTLEEVAFLEQQKEKVIAEEIMAAVEKAKGLNADVFGFGEAVHKKYPNEWTAMEDGWDEIFPTVEVEINVDAKLRLMGRISVPAVPQ